MMETGWYPLALSSAIEAGTSAGAVVLGQEIVVWRDQAGAAHTWEDRCPHRGMKLSFGFVRGDHIACLYHGWEFDAAGQCRYIPAHPKIEVPKTICTRRHAMAEAAGMIWVHLGEGEGAAPQGDAMLPVRSLYLDCPAAKAAAALAAAFGALGPVATDGALWRFDTDLGPVAVGVQPVDEGRSALHVTAAGDAPARITLARRAETLRRDLETAMEAGA